MKVILKIEKSKLLKTAKISTENLLEIFNKVIKGLEQRNFIVEHELISAYRIKIIAHPKMWQKKIIRNVEINDFTTGMFFFLI